MIKGGFGWKIGNGKDISLWFDTWLEYDPLCLLIEEIDPNEILWNVSDIIDERGSWNLTILTTTLPATIIDKIIKTRLDINGTMNDTVVWKGSNNGVPSVKSFFNFISKVSQEENETMDWQWIRKLTCPQKLRFFIWLIMKNKLLTNLYRFKIGVASTDMCPRCNLCSETLIHLLRDCQKSRELWENFIPESKRSNFFNYTTQHWIKSNAMDELKIGSKTNTDWQILFISIGWHIWKGRNEEVFDAVKFSHVKVASLASMYAMDIQISSNNFSNFSLDPVNGRRNKPPPGYYKLNIDGGFRDGQGTFGGVLRNEKGEWIWGYKGRSSATDSLHAEIIALMIGIKTLVGKNCSRIIIETDSSQSVNLLFNTVDEVHPRKELVAECKVLLAQVWNSTVIYGPRIGNKVADMLAKLGYDLDHNTFVWVDVIHPFIKEALLNDIYMN